MALPERQQVLQTAELCGDTSQIATSTAARRGAAVLLDCTCALFDAQEVWVAAQALLDVIRDVLPRPTCRHVDHL